MRLTRTGLTGTRMIRLAAASALVLLTAGCSGRSAALPPEDSAEIAAAVLEHLFRNNASALQSSAAAYCVQLPSPTLEAAVLGRFSGRSPAVLPASACRGPLPEEGGGVRLAASGRPALGFTIDQIERSGRRSARVQAGYSEASLSAAGYECRLERGRRTWTVRACDLQWISFRTGRAPHA